MLSVTQFDLFKTRCWCVGRFTHVDLVLLVIFLQESLSCDGTLLFPPFLLMQSLQWDGNGVFLLKIAPDLKERVMSNRLWPACKARWRVRPLATPPQGQPDLSAVSHWCTSCRDDIKRSLSGVFSALLGGDGLPPGLPGLLKLIAAAQMLRNQYPLHLGPYLTRLQLCVWTV